MDKRYGIRAEGFKGSLGIRWSPLDPRWSEGSMYGPSGRYVTVGVRDTPHTRFFRNPFAKPLISNGGKR